MGYLKSTTYRHLTYIVKFHQTEQNAWMYSLNTIHIIHVYEMCTQHQNRGKKTRTETEKNDYKAKLYHE